MIAAKATSMSRTATARRRCIGRHTMMTATSRILDPRWRLGDAVTRNGALTPLLVASANGSAVVVQKLLAAGAKSDVPVYRRGDAADAGRRLR